MSIPSNVGSIAIAVSLCCGHSTLAQSVRQKTFTTPEDAVVALVDSDKAGDIRALRALFGAGGETLLASGDPVMDQRNREVFLIAYAEQATLMAVSPNRSILYIGNEQWPFPIPLVKEAQAWRFDAAAGAQEILYRRIGRNELTTIQVCRAFVDAQQEYATRGHDGRPAGAYAQKITSTPGRQDGLYWKSDDGEQLSPLGEFAAAAAVEGYQHIEGRPAPFHGYYFRILTAGVSSANQTAASYITNGEMRGGFALIASPAAYGSSGVMSFMVDQNGAVYEKDFGSKTRAIAAAIAQFKIDSSWKKVAEQ